MDRVWWKEYGDEVNDVFTGMAATPVRGIRGTERVHSHDTQNSGAGAIALAASMGAKRIFLLGYDCQHTGGKAHWHGNHPKGLGNAGSFAKWPAQFNMLAAKLPKIEVINCSRETALMTFPRGTLEDVL
jgi:hypothetical protein